MRFHKAFTELPILTMPNRIKHLSFKNRQTGELHCPIRAVSYILLVQLQWKIRGPAQKTSQRKQTSIGITGNTVPKTS